MQGKQYKKAKREAKNYKELKDELKNARLEQKADLVEAKASGTADYRNLRKKKFVEDHKRKLKEITQLERWGAPQDEGRADRKLKKIRKIGTGNVGSWHRGKLVLSKRDLKQMVFESLLVCRPFSRDKCTESDNSLSLCSLSLSHTFLFREGCHK